MPTSGLSHQHVQCPGRYRSLKQLLQQRVPHVKRAELERVFFVVRGERQFLESQQRDFVKRRKFSST